MRSASDKLKIVLHQVHSPDNFGAVARLAANFGFSRLALSDPRPAVREGAEKLAVRAEAILENCEVTSTLEQALDDVIFVLGSTSRRVVKGRQTLNPEVAVEILASHAERGRVALLLGGEKRGLSDEDLSRCHGLVCIPTRQEQPSMNLSQAAAVLLYLCSREFDGEQTAPISVEGARMETLRALESQMSEVLQRVGFLNPQAPEHVVRELARALVKGEISQRVAEMWISAFAHVDRALKAR